MIAACQHITNFSAGHETRSTKIGDERLSFPTHHIEADNRLSWFLGRLEAVYGDNAIYIHLLRDQQAVARSFANRFGTGIIRAYDKGLLMRGDQKREPIDVCKDYCKTVNENIALFLKNKTHQMRFTLENAEQDFPEFWKRIDAQGNLEAALDEFRVKHNATESILRKQVRKLTGR